MTDYLDRDPSIYPVLPISATGPPLESDSPPSGLPTLDPATGGVRVTIVGGSVTIGAEVEIKNDAGNPVPVSDSGGSLTTDSPQLPSALGQATMAASLPVVVASNQSALPVSGTVTTNAGTNTSTALLNLETTQTTVRDNVGATNESAAGTDTATSGLNGLFKRLLQRFTALIALLPASIGQKTSAGSVATVLATDQSAIPTNATVTNFPATQTVSGSVTANAGTNLNTSALALDTTVGTTNTRVGDLTETAPGTDTASSGLNGRLQRIAQRITSFIALLPASLGQTTMANSLAVTVASDQSAIPTTLPTSTTANTPSIASASTAISANASRKSWALQNMGTLPLYVRLSTGASTTVFHIVLKAGIVNDDGNGGYVSDEIWKGEVSVASTGTARYVATELT